MRLIKELLNKYGNTQPEKWKNCFKTARIARCKKNVRRSDKGLDNCTRKKCRGVARPMQDGERRQRGRRIVEKKFPALGRSQLESPR